MSRIKNPHTKNGVDNLNLIPDVKQSLVCNIANIDVWLVDGTKIRDNIFVDFTEGGNTEAYPWMPSDEIWIDNKNEDELLPILVHEFVEYYHMKQGDSYDTAHDKANKEEVAVRRKKKVAEEVLSEYIKKMKPITSSKKFLKLVKENHPCGKQSLELQQ